LTPDVAKAQIEKNKVENHRRVDVKVDFDHHAPKVGEKP
jgi:hypothetical protein